MGIRGAIDLETFIDLLLNNQGKVMGYCYNRLGDWALAEDAAQEVFLRAWRYWGSVQDKEHANTWLWRIASRVVLDMASTRHRTIPNIEELEADVIAVDEDRLAIRFMLEELPAHLKQVIVLFYIDGYSYEEIAAILHIPVSTVRGRLYEARKNLKQTLSRQRGSEEKVIYELLAHLWQLTDDTDAKLENWQLNQKRMLFSRGTGSFGNALSIKKDWSDYDFTAEFQVQSVGTNASALRFFWRNEKIWQGYGLSLCVDRSFIHRFEGDWRRTFFLGEARETFELQKKHKINMRIVGNRFRVYFDGNLILDVKDPEQIYKKGGVGIRTDDLSVVIENVKVTLL